MKKRLLLMLSAMLVTLFWTNVQFAQSSNSDLVGTWRIMAYQFTFDSKGNVILEAGHLFSDDIDVTTGTYKQNGSTVEMTLKGKSGSYIVMGRLIENNGMTVQFYNPKGNKNGEILRFTKIQEEATSSSTPNSNNNSSNSSFCPGADFQCNDYYGCNWNGEICFNEKKYDLAIKYFNKAIELEPKRAVFFYRLSKAYQQKGDYDRAILNMSKAIELEPISGAYNRRGWLYYLKGDYDRALADANKSLQLEPNVAEVLDTRARAYLGIGKYELALIDINKAIEIKPKEYWGYEARALIYRKMGRVSLAEADEKKVLDLKGNK